MLSPVAALNLNHISDTIDTHWVFNYSPLVIGLIHSVAFTLLLSARSSSFTIH
uniref:Uncharacterized protein n=1 Tax=Arundo donax TaxID=35708 RepID=A0A0A8ZIA0_ARUDO